MADHITEEHDDSALDVLPAAATFHIVTLHGGNSGSVHEPAGTQLSIGRAFDDQRADLTFDDARMSRLHARIERDASGWKLIDLGSRNGGFIDGVPFASNGRVQLLDGAVFRLGNSLFVFRACPADRQIDSEREVFPGGSPAATTVRRRVKALANATGHVLILGETGTGKERVARRIGRGSSLRPFIPQNCAEIRPDLARSELFGHVRGAFSGATTAKEGLVDAARDGTLFLDELGELPLDVQADLLRFLEDGTYRPVGATELRSSACRIVAATNVDLDHAVEQKTFRRDLLARLRASNRPLELPALRDRREDILGWARLFLDEAFPREPPPEIWTTGAAECLVLYPWPENLRELRGVMRSLLETVHEWPLDSTALPEKIQVNRRRLRAGGATEVELVHDDVEVIDPDREAIEQALAATDGRMRAASVLLGVDRRKLYRLCERLNINISSYRNGE